MRKASQAANIMLRIWPYLKLLLLSGIIRSRNCGVFSAGVGAKHESVSAALWRHLGFKRWWRCRPTVDYEEPADFQAAMMCSVNPRSR